MYKEFLNETEKNLQEKLALDYNAENIKNDCWLITIDPEDFENIDLNDLEKGNIKCSKSGIAMIGNIQLDIAGFYLSEKYVPSDEEIICVYDFTTNFNLGL